MLTTPTSHHRGLSARVIICAAIMINVPGCGQPVPLDEVPGVQVFSSEETIAPLDPFYWNTLQVTWLGSASYYIQLGDAAILTDPFFTHHDLMTALFGTIESDPVLVEQKIAGLRPAHAIFLGHTHYDHMLGLVPTLDQPGWSAVPVYGNTTAKHILCGYGAEYEDNWQAARADDAWHTVPLPDKSVTTLEYKAIVSEHAPQIPGVDLFPGRLEECLPGPPRTGGDFLKGENFAYVFRLSNPDAVFSIYMAASATNEPIGFPDESVQAVDLAILGVAGWTNVQGYPGAFIDRLQPRYVLPAHYNDFFSEPDNDTPVLSLADLEGFLGEVEEVFDMDRCPVIHVDSLVTFGPPPMRNTMSRLR